MGRIIWLASYPKSGNTWTRAFLHNLFRNPQTPFDINRMDELTANEAALPNFQQFDKRPWSDWTPGDVAAMRPQVQKMIADSRPHTIFCKTHLAVLEVRDHPTINLNVTAGAIYLVRNPLDIVSSLSDHQGLTIDQTIEMMTVANFETPTTETMAGEPWGNWSQNVESWTGQPNPALHVIRYEDLLERPTKVFAGLAKFLHVDAPRARIERAVKNSSFKVLRKLEERDGFQEKTSVQERFFRQGRAGGWHDELTEQQVKSVVDVHRAQMERFGYVPEGM